MRTSVYDELNTWHIKLLHHINAQNPILPNQHCCSLIASRVQDAQSCQASSYQLIHSVYQSEERKQSCSPLLFLFYYDRKTLHLTHTHTGFQLVFVLQGLFLQLQHVLEIHSIQTQLCSFCSTVALSSHHTESCGRVWTLADMPLVHMTWQYNLLGSEYRYFSSWLDASPLIVLCIFISRDIHQKVIIHKCHSVIN